MSARDKVGLAKFADVKKFFESWGLFPYAENVPGDLNPEVIEQGINRRCYEKLLIEAKGFNSSTYRDYFQTFAAKAIEAVDDAYYLGRKTWKELEEDWDNYIAEL